MGKLADYKGAGWNFLDDGKVLYLGLMGAQSFQNSLNYLEFYSV